MSYTLDTEGTGTTTNDQSVSLVAWDDTQTTWDSAFGGWDTSSVVTLDDEPNANSLTWADMTRIWQDEINTWQDTLGTSYTLDNEPT